MQDIAKKIENEGYELLKFYFLEVHTFYSKPRQGHPSLTDQKKEELFLRSIKPHILGLILNPSILANRSYRFKEQDFPNDPTISKLIIKLNNTYQFLVEAHTGQLSVKTCSEKLYTENLEEHLFLKLKDSQKKTV